MKKISVLTVLLSLAFIALGGNRDFSSKEGATIIENARGDLVRIIPPEALTPDGLTIVSIEPREKETLEKCELKKK